MELRNLIKATVVVFALGLASPLWGATQYYVATNGNDANTGTSLSAPFRTIQKAAASVRAGDTVYVRAGKYAPVFINNKYGTASNRIVFKPYNNEHVIIDRELGGETAQYPIYIVNASYLTVEGFEVTDSFAHRLGLFELDICNKDGSLNQENLDTHLKYRRNSENLPWGEGVVINGHTVEHLILKDLYIHHNKGIGLSSHGGTPTGASFNNHYINNRIYRNGHYGMYINGKNAVIRGNIVTYNDAYGAQLIYDYLALENPLIENNIFANNGQALCIWHSDKAKKTAGDGFLLMAVNAVVRNNIVTGNRTGGISIFHQSKDSLYANNTVVGNRGYGFQEWFRTKGNIKIQNNIIFQNKTPFTGLKPETILSHNLETDPKFVDAKNNDFRLTKESPAIDAGLTLALVTNDFLGTPRPQGAGYDIGAYEFISSSVPRLPAAPSDLRLEK